MIYGKIVLDRKWYLMDNDTEKKVIPKKNYVIVVVMFVALVILNI